MLVVVVLLIATPLMAANPDSINLLITPTYNLSVNIQDTEYNFSSGSNIDLGDTTVNTAAITVENDGDVRSYWQKECDDDDWTIETSASAILGQNKFRLGAMMQGSQPDQSDFDLSLDSILVTGAATHLFGGYHKDPTDTGSLWLRIEVPNEVAAGGGSEQTLVFSVTAVAQ
jgi:hypothetical protein